MISASRLPLHAQKAVVGRLLGLEIIVPQRARLELQGFHDAVTRLESHLYWATNEALDDPDAKNRLDVFLRNVVKELYDEAARLSSTARTAVTQLVDELSVLVTDFCSAPYDPLERLANATAKTSAEFYQTYAAEVPDELWLHSVPVFEFLGGKKGLSFAPDVHLRIRTKFETNDPMASHVIFEVTPRWLDATTMATVPRVALHEYIAHVPQGPYSQTRSHPSPTDAFAEGWMDYLAHRVYRSVLEQRGPCQALFTCLVPAWLSLYERASERFFDARTELRDSDPAAAARSEGSQAARQLHDLFRGLPETSEDPDTPLYRLSFALNCSSLSGVERQRIVAEIRANLASASVGYILVQALRDWATGKITLSDLSNVLLA
jgi:hypothetical protein